MTRDRFTKHLDRFVARTMANLSDRLSERKEDLVTLLRLLPKNYARRTDIMIVLRGIQQHERAQSKFQSLLETHNGGK